MVKKGRQNWHQPILSVGVKALSSYLILKAFASERQGEEIIFKGACCVTEQDQTLGEGLKCVAVMLATPLPFAGAVLDYLVPLSAPEGAVVIVPLGSRKVPGVVIGPAESKLDQAKVKRCYRCVETPPIPSGQIAWLKKVAGWTMANQGAVLKMMLPSAQVITPPEPVMGWVAAMPPDESLPAKRQAVLEVAFGAIPSSLAEIARLAGVSASTTRAMAEQGLLRQDVIPPSEAVQPDPDHPGLALNPEQKEAAAAISTAIGQRHYAPFVIDGVTGSGKTEVYFEAVAETLRVGRQALILLPEIALSPAMVDRFTTRFGAPPVLWHSGLGDRQRQSAWQNIRRNEPLVVVGARSALFLPFADLGLIVIDEEHDGSYKQDDQVVYHARDMAVMRASLEKAVMVMVSATPSLETEVNIDKGRYQRLRLSSRAGRARLPEISLVDLRKTPPERQKWLAPPLVDAIRARLEQKQQVLLFLNRRGYAPVTLCRTCGERITCPHCSAWLVTHLKAGQMRCHHCGHTSRFPDHCPSCDSEASLVPCGPGVERLAEEVSSRFPEARQAVLSSDHVTSHAGLTALMNDITAGEVDIIIGTQMVAKGHDFPNLTLVGVVDADLGLGGGDLRAAERTWQMLVQVAGRAGRADQPGMAILQTAAPETDVLQRLMRGDRDGFIEEEKAARMAAEMPPYSRLAAIVLSATSPMILNESVAQIAAAAPRYDGVTILGPAPAPMAILRGRHRMRFLIRCSRDVNLQAILREWLDPLTFPASVRLQIDIDPYHFI